MNCPICNASDGWNGIDCSRCQNRLGAAGSDVMPESSNSKEAIDMVGFAKEFIDSKVIADRISEHRELLFSNMRSKLRSALSSMEPSATLSFNLMSGGSVSRSVELALPPPGEYIPVLIAFMRGKDYKYYDIDSFVTPVAMRVVESSIADFYANSTVSAALSEALTDQLVMLTKIKEVVKGEMGDQQRWMGREVASMLKTNMGEAISSQMAQRLGENIHTFVYSSAGKTFLASISKMLAGGAGKILVSKLAVTVSHVVSTAAFKAALMTTIKKIGVTVLVKTAIGKAIIAVLAVLGISVSIPIAWIIAPILLAFLAYEYTSLPEKLADKVPDEVISVLRYKFTEMNEQITKEIIAGIFSTLTKEKQDANLAEVS